jgi:carbohydrate-selective porin OprB
MRTRATAAIAAVLLCAASLGSAQNRAGTVMCGTWLAERGARESGIQWVLGWLSTAGYHIAGGDFAPLSEHDSVAAWLHNYCREHPLSNILTAAASLVAELSKPQ